MRRNQLMGLAFALAAASSAQALSAQTAPPQPRPEQHDGRGHQGGRHAEGRGPHHRLFQGVTLTTRQQEQVRAIMQANRPQRDSAGRGLRGQDGARRGERPRLTEAQMQARRAQMQQQRARTFQQIREVLNAEQRTQFDRNVQEMEARRAQGGEHGGRGERGHRGRQGQRQGPGSRS